MRVTCLCLDGVYRTAELPLTPEVYRRAMDAIDEGLPREAVRAVMPRLNERQFGFFYDGAHQGVAIVRVDGEDRWE
jgi:hypothetical protein